MNSLPSWQHLKKYLLTNKYESLSFGIRLGLFLLDLAGTALFFPLRLLRRQAGQYDPQGIKKILILRMDGLGDLVLSTAALREIRKGFPEAEITLVIGPWSAGIAPCIPFYDRLIIHNAFAFGIFRGERRMNLKKELSFIRNLRGRCVDLGIDLRGDILSIVPLFLSGARFRFGRDRWGGGFLLTHPVATDKSRDVHEKDKTLALLEALKIPIRDRELELLVPKEAVSFVDRFLEERQIPLEGGIVTVAPAALYPWRAWPSERYADLITLLVKEKPCWIFLLGGPGDWETLERIKEKSGGRSFNCSGLLSLCQTAALLQRASLFIGNDSGLSHIAAAVKAPLVQLFGPGEPEKFGHKGPKQIVMQKVGCTHHPCHQRECLAPQDWCMNKIAVNDVLEAVRRLYHD